MIEPTGYTALDLIGFTDRGGYDPDAYYVKNDIATVGNTKWRCLIDDTHNVTPTEGANWTIYLESATSLAGMDDVTLTSPKNGDGLVHDGNDWKNVPIMTKEQWKKNGAYNICPNTMSSAVENGITASVNSDGTVSISGTASADTTFIVCNKAPIDNLDYVLSGCPTGGSASSYYFMLYLYHGTSWDATKFEYGEQAYVKNKSDNINADNFKLEIKIKSGTVITTPITFKPMITTDLNATYADYEPYAKTNGELTEELKTVPNGNGIFFTKATGGSIEQNASWAERYGKVIVVNLQVKFSASASSPTLGTLSIKPKYSATAVVNAPSGTIATVSINTSTGNVTFNGTVPVGWVYGQLVFVYE